MRIIRPHAPKPARYATLRRDGYICPDCRVPIIRDRETDRFLCLKCGRNESRAEYRKTLHATIAMLKQEQEQEQRQQQEHSLGVRLSRICSKELAVVYYLEMGNLIKIGTSTNLHGRLDTLPWERVLLTERGSYALERERHVQFSEYHKFREWFTKSDELMNFIEQRRDELATDNAKIWGKELPFPWEHGTNIPGVAQVAYNLRDEINHDLPEDIQNHVDTVHGMNSDLMDNVLL